jgi:hypothetical protein
MVLFQVFQGIMIILVIVFWGLALHWFLLASYLAEGKKYPGFFFTYNPPKSLKEFLGRTPLLINSNSLGSNQKVVEALERRNFILICSYVVIALHICSVIIAQVFFFKAT